MSIQLSGSLLEMCVLAIVRKEDTYGYRLTQEIKQEFDLSESSLYPVLRRLTRSGCLKTYDRPYDGRMRRYYSLTEQGEEQLKQSEQEWTRLQNSVGALLQKGENHDEK